MKQLARFKELELSKDEKSAIMSDEICMTRTSNTVNMVAERIVKATQVIVKGIEKNSINRNRICERKQS